jgi:hypothetical protein
MAAGKRIGLQGENYDIGIANAMPLKAVGLTGMPGISPLRIVAGICCYNNTFSSFGSIQIGWCMMPLIFSAVSTIIDRWWHY